MSTALINKTTKTKHSRATDRDHAYANAIVTRVRDELSRSNYAALRTFTCECHCGILAVSGRSPNFYLKQVAVSLVMRCLQSQAAGNISGVDVDGISVRGHVPCDSLI